MKAIRQAGRPRQELFRRYGMLLVLVVMVFLASMLSDRFLTASNLLNVTQQVTINAILAAGMTIVIISGGIDPVHRLGCGHIWSVGCRVDGHGSGLGSWCAGNPAGGLGFRYY